MSDYEVIEVKLPRGEYEVLKVLIKEREAKNWITAKLSSWWMFGVGAGALVLWNLWDKIFALKGI